MKPQKTTARTSVDLDATDEFPVLDAAAYEAEVLSREPPESSDSWATATASDASAAGSPVPDQLAPRTAPAVADPDAMLAVEHWITQKTEELRSHHEALGVVQREHKAAVAHAAELSRKLAEASASIEAQNGRERALAEALTGEQEAARRRAAELDAARRDAARLAAEVKALQAQLADCVESLYSRESYRGIYESALQELDAERGEGERRRTELESRLAELTAEHVEACARLLATEAALQAAQQRLEAEALASRTAAERQGELESAIESRHSELTNARLEIERSRVLLADLTAALLKSQTMFSDQGRLLEEREAAASAMAASHVEQAALIATLRGQIAELTARLATPETERRALEEQVAALTREVMERESRLTRLEVMNAELRSTVGQLNASLADRDAELQRATQLASTNAYALGRVQSSIDELGRTLTASEGASALPQVGILTRIDGGQNHSVVLRGRTTIGRDRDNDLALAMRSVSRHHAVLIPAFRAAFVQDLSSTNGVLVNRRRVRCARLQHGDLITFGEAQFRYTVTPAAAGAFCRP